jgi:quercetin 2,3-dioxygenase
MLQIRKSNERGHAEHGWLESHHTFSFAEYYEPAFMGYRVLRVINEDRIAGAKGFPDHPHQDMEIITYVISGALEHRDTLGNHSKILPGEVQRMSAGTGIRHSEFNPLINQETHLLQIWILPAESGLNPSYEQKSFAQSLRDQDLVLVASLNGRDGSLRIHQDVDLYVAKWNSARQCEFRFSSIGRYGWLQLISGELSVAGQKVSEGDGLAIAAEESLLLRTKGAAEFLLFDLP